MERYCLAMGNRGRETKTYNTTRIQQSFEQFIFNTIHNQGFLEYKKFKASIIQELTSFLRAMLAFSITPFNVRVKSLTRYRGYFDRKIGQ
jgi:hypothetical protein